MVVDGALVEGVDEVVDTVVDVGCAVDVLVDTTTGVGDCVEEELGLGAALVDGGSEEETGGAEDAGVLEVVVALLAVEDGGGVPVTTIVPFCDMQRADDWMTSQRSAMGSTHDTRDDDSSPRGGSSGTRRCSTRRRFSLYAKTD